MPQIKSVVCRQACVACWPDVLVKNDETSVYYFLFEAIFRCISRPVRTNKHQNFSQSGQSDLIVIAIRAEPLRIQAKQHTDNLLSLLESVKKCLRVR